MKYSNNYVDEVKIAYIGGGSRGWAWTLMTDLAMDDMISGTVCLYDIDKDAAKVNEVIGNRLSAREDVIGKWEYVVADTMEDALTGADFVIISIQPKTFDEMEVDVHMPERLGIYQSVGDTVGPGGAVRAMRTIPMFIEFANAIKKYCPKAWVINYTNPMALCVKALYSAFPEIKAFGCCHEVFATQRALAKITEKELGLTEIPREDIHVNVLGINHFTWFDQADYKGVDIFPLYRDYVEKNFEQGDMDSGNWVDTLANTNRVKMDLFRRYGLIAAAGDRHLAEFMPGEEYLRNPETVEKWKFELKTVAYRKEDLVRRMERADRLFAGEEEIELKPTGEEGLVLIKALCGLGRLISNVNIPNTSKQIWNVPEAAVVETNAVFDRDSIRPIAAGEIPENVLALVMPHVDNQERILKAAVDVDKELLLEAFLNDPLVKDRVSEEEARLLMEDMLEATL